MAVALIALLVMSPVSSLLDDFDEDFNKSGERDEPDNDDQGQDFAEEIPTITKLGTKFNTIYICCIDLKQTYLKFLTILASLFI